MNQIFFLYICQIKSLKKILKNIEENEVLIVCDDILLIQAVKKNLSEHQVETGANLLFKILTNLIIHYYRFVKNSIIGLIDIIFTIQLAIQFYKNLFNKKLTI